METAKGVPIPDRKSVDRFGNPTRWILRIVEPQELRGMIAFPEGFTVRPNQMYTVEIVRRGKNYAVVRLHEHVYEEVRREEDPYLIKIVYRCKCGAIDVRYITKYNLPFVDGWKNRWYVRYAVQLRQQSESIIRNAPAPQYYYVAVRNAEVAEKLFATMRRRSLDEASSVICKEYRSVIYDDEEKKWRTLEAWRGAEDKSWVCTNSPPVDYIPTLGWVDKNTFEEYTKAKIESERLWNVAEDVLGIRIDVGRCIPDGRGGCRRYASRIAEFL
jgi:hypothetical protein